MSSDTAINLQKCMWNDNDTGLQFWYFYQSYDICAGHVPNLKKN